MKVDPRQTVQPEWFVKNFLLNSFSWIDFQTVKPTEIDVKKLLNLASTATAAVTFNIAWA